MKVQKELTAVGAETGQVTVTLSEVEARFVADFIDRSDLCNINGWPKVGAETADLLARKIREVTNV